MDKISQVLLSNSLQNLPSAKIRAAVTDLFSVHIPKFNKCISEIENTLKKKKANQANVCSRVFSCMDSLLKYAAKVEHRMNDKNAAKMIKKLFRNGIKQFIDKSTLMRWGYEKPTGHPGDYKIIEYFYDNLPISSGMGFFGDLYILQDEYVEAIRIRKEMMKKMLRSFFSTNYSKELKILNLGCGSCRELQEFFSSNYLKMPKKLHFTLVDWDKAALTYSEKTLTNYRNEKVSFSFMSENVFTMHRNGGVYVQKYYPQNLIYSIGLVDYMPNLIFAEMIKFCFALLARGGALIIAHKNVKVCNSLASDWACDWHFFPRDINDVKHIINTALCDKKFNLRFVTDATKHIFFIKVVKE